MGICVDCMGSEQFAEDNLQKDNLPKPNLPNVKDNLTKFIRQIVPSG